MSRSRGFTLIEVLAVMAIILMAAALTLPRVTGSFAEQRQRKGVSDVVIFLHRARVEALERGKTVRIGRGGGTLSAEVVSGGEAVGSMAVPEEISIPDGAFLEGLEFYPLGNSSGGECVLTAGTAKYLLTVDQLTGEVESRRAEGETATTAGG